MLIFIPYRQREKRGSGTKRTVQAIATYWSDLQTNIFRNYCDALFGIIPLVLLPASSLAPALAVAEADFWNYTFPISCISTAGIYDAYGRLESHKPKNLKLGFRMALNFTALLLSALLVDHGKYVRMIPGAILTLCGIFLLGEIWQRVVTSIQMSEWYPG